MESLPTEVLQRVAAFKKQMAVSVIGQERLIDDILVAYIAGGHVLLEGAPGLAKTCCLPTSPERSSLILPRIALRYERVRFLRM